MAFGRGRRCRCLIRTKSSVGAAVGGADRGTAGVAPGGGGATGGTAGVATCGTAGGAAFGAADGRSGVQWG